MAAAALGMQIESPRSSSGRKLPVIDGHGFLAADKSDAHPPADVAKLIAEAGQTVGSFQLINHGVDQEVIGRLQVTLEWWQTGELC
jgi:hypothetical protein